MSDLEEQFGEKMVDIYRRAKDECGYNATRFLSMLFEMGGVAIAKALLQRGSPQYGFEALWERKRLDLTVETLVLQGPRHQLLSPADLEAAKSRLEQHGYPIP